MATSRSSSGRPAPGGRRGAGPRSGTPRTGGASATGGAAASGGGAGKGSAPRGAAKGGASRGAAKGGASRTGAPKGGASRTGAPKGAAGAGAPRGGAAKGGSPRTGAPKAGAPRNPAPGRGAPQGAGAQGTAPRGGAKGGASRTGAPKAAAQRVAPGERGPRPFASSERSSRRMPATPYRPPHRKRRPTNPPVDRLDQHDPEGVRLQKLMAQAGVASRRVCEEMIEAGRVQVNGETVTELGLRVDPETVEIHVDGIRVQLDENLVYYAFNKPEGVLSTMDDPEGRPCVSDFLNRQRNERVFHVGRLDVETEGLLLLTNDGELTNRLTHPSYEVPKTYLVQVRGPMDKGVGAAMKAGIELEDGIAAVDSFRLVDSTPGHLLVEVVLHSGRNRVVRRLFDAVGHPVEKLVRTQVGPIRIGDQRQGTVRKLSKTEVGHLLASVGM